MRLECVEHARKNFRISWTSRKARIIGAAAASRHQQCKRSAAELQNSSCAVCVSTKRAHRLAAHRARNVKEFGVLSEHCC